MKGATDADTLRRVPLFKELPEDKLTWISEQGEEVRLEPGTKIVSQGDPPDGFYVVLEGESVWTRRVGSKDVFVVSLGEGSAFSKPIMVLDAPYPTAGHAVTPMRLLKLEAPTFWELLKLCPEILRGILTTSVERAELHESISQRHAKLVSLGTLTAGLAHELNNPAAVSLRAAGRLRECFERLRKTGMKISRSAAAGDLGPEQLDDLDRIAAGALGSMDGTPDGLSPLEAADREENLAQWLEERGVEDVWDLASTFAQASLEVPDLERVIDIAGRDCLGEALGYLEAVLTVAGLVEEVEASTTRVSALVETMKAYSHMDQAPLQELQINDELDNTLEILAYELEEVEMVRMYDEDLPRITAYGGELNQVWTALIDNAIDAVKGDVDEPRITLRTTCESDRVLVEVADNGPGIPEELRAHVFEPYFTTKGIGAGSGIGLDVSYRSVVGRHGGDIRVVSRPGDTRFQVRLPIEGPTEQGTPAAGGSVEAASEGGR